MSYQEMADKAFKKGSTENLTPTYIEWETEGQTIVGMLKGKVTIESSKNKGVYTQYMIDTDDGLIKFHLGQVTDGEAGSVMEIGGIYHIEYQGQLKIGGGKSVNKFHVERINS